MIVSEIPPLVFVCFIISFLICVFLNLTCKGSDGDD